MNTTLYTVVMYLLTPVILYRLTVRGFKARAYFWRWRERFGFFPEPDFKDSFWVHAVSVGEFNAALPLIRQMMRNHPDRTFVITTVTPTGSDQVVRTFGERVFHVYLPYDLPAAVNRFLDRVRPEFGVIMETEIWPNLFHACRRRGIPIVVANARLSERSLRGYRPVRSLAANALNCATAVAAQTETDRERLLRLGGRPEILHVVGSLKVDLQLPPGVQSQGQTMRNNWGPGRLVVVAASTHEDDEEFMLPAFKRLLEIQPDALMVVAPRHPERFARVIARCRAMGFATRSRSEERYADADTECFVLDTLGELLNYYAAADLAFVGGSLAKVGGHNVLEPAALAVPVLVGPHTFNFSEITALLLDRGGARRVTNQKTLTDSLLQLAAESATRKRMGQAARQLVQENRGALKRTLDLVYEARRGRAQAPAPATTEGTG